MKLPPLIALVAIGLFLYWVVQDPVGAAIAIKSVGGQAGSLSQLLADRFVQFLSAL